MNKASLLLLVCYTIYLFANTPLSLAQESSDDDYPEYIPKKIDIELLDSYPMGDIAETNDLLSAGKRLVGANQYLTTYELSDRGEIEVLSKTDTLTDIYLIDISPDGNWLLYSEVRNGNTQSDEKLGLLSWDNSSLQWIKSPPIVLHDSRSLSRAKQLSNIGFTEEGNFVAYTDLYNGLSIFRVHKESKLLEPVVEKWRPEEFELFFTAVDIGDGKLIALGLLPGEELLYDFDITTFEISNPANIPTPPLAEYEANFHNYYDAINNTLLHGGDAYGGNVLRSFNFEENTSDIVYEGPVGTHSLVRQLAMSDSIIAVTVMGDWNDYVVVNFVQNGERIKIAVFDDGRFAFSENIFWHVSPTDGLSVYEVVPEATVPFVLVDRSVDGTDNNAHFTEDNSLYYQQTQKILSYTGCQLRTFDLPTRDIEFISLSSLDIPNECDSSVEADKNEQGLTFQFEQNGLLHHVTVSLDWEGKLVSDRLTFTPIESALWYRIKQSVESDLVVLSYDRPSSDGYNNVTANQIFHLNENGQLTKLADFDDDFFGHEDATSIVRAIWKNTVFVQFSYRDQNRQLFTGTKQVTISTQEAPPLVLDISHLVDTYSSKNVFDDKLYSYDSTNDYSDSNGKYAVSVFRLSEGSFPDLISTTRTHSTRYDYHTVSNTNTAQLFDLDTGKSWIPEQPELLTSRVNSPILLGDLSRINSQQIVPLALPGNELAFYKLHHSPIQHTKLPEMLQLNEGAPPVLLTEWIGDIDPSDELSFVLLEETTGVTLQPDGRLSVDSSASSQGELSVESRDNFGLTYSFNVAFSANKAPQFSPPEAIWTNPTVPLELDLQSLLSDPEQQDITIVLANEIEDARVNEQGMFYFVTSNPGKYSFDFSASDEDGAVKVFQLEVNVNTPPSIASTAFPRVMVNATINIDLFDYFSDAEEHQLTFELEGLPSFLTRNDTQISGSHSSAGNYTFTVLATDELGASTELQFSVVIEEPNIEPESSGGSLHGLLLLMAICLTRRLRVSQGAVSKSVH